MLKSLGLLSHKGGVGKTSIAVNLAVYLAKIGKNVILLDNDFHGPALMTFFHPEVMWLNKYLLENISLADCLQNVSTELNLSGNLYVGFADPTAQAVQTIIRIDQQKSIAMLQKLLQLKKQVVNTPYHADYLIIDCSPGTGYSTVNVMLATDSSLFIVKISNADLIGTSQMISGLYKQLKSRSLVLANLIPQEVVADKKNQIENLIEERFQQDIGDKVVKFLGWIPTDTKLQLAEFREAVKTLKGKQSTRPIYTLDYPSHIFSTMLINLIPTLFPENQSKQ